MSDTEINLPTRLSPTTEVEVLPKHINIHELLTEYDAYIREASNFELFQGVLNKIMLEKGIEEQYRMDLAGALNQYREHFQLEVI